MAQHQITILGAGLTGLILSRCLLARGIRTVLYERDKEGPRYVYGITLRSSAYRKLLPLLNLDEKAFRRRVAVDGAVGGVGREASSPSESAGVEGHGEVEGEVYFRANRMRLEELLREGLEIKFEHKLASVTLPSSSPSNKESPSDNITLSFANDQKATTHTLLDTSGIHSQTLRTISPPPRSDPKILPWVVYNGKRRLKPSAFKSQYAAHFKETNSLSHRLSSGILLAVSVNEITDEKASLSYTFSRPAYSTSSSPKKEEEDPLYRPQRSMSGASAIPEGFYEAIDTLAQLPQPFASIFDSAAMKEDRVLNWLMRSARPIRQDLETAAREGVVLLGDAAHGGPILGSWGACEAVEDAMALAEIIAADPNGGSEWGRKLYEARWGVWEGYVEGNEGRLGEMHGVERANL